MRRLPPFEPLLRVHRALEQAGIPHALGGSGLLFHLGLCEAVRDWDVTTDEPWERVRPALAGLTFELILPRGVYATEAMGRVQLDGCELDVMARFAVRTSGGVCRIPTIATGEWRGVPLGCPEAWAVAYLLLDREERAAALLEHLGRNGGCAGSVARMLKEPLPAHVRARLAFLGAATH